MANRQLRAEVVERVRRALAEAGGRVAAVNQAEIVREYLVQGGKRITLFAWVKRALEAVPGEDAVAKATAIGDEALAAIPLVHGDREMVILPAGRATLPAAVGGPAVTALMTRFGRASAGPLRSPAMI